MREMIETKTQPHNDRWRRLQLAPILLVALPLIFLGVFFLYPIGSILRLSFAPQGEPELSVLASLFSTPYYLQALWFTIWQAVVSTALTLAVGLPAAYVFARYSFPGKPLLRALTTIPFVLPTVVVAAAFSSLIGQNGIINRALMDIFALDHAPIQLMGTIWIILLAHVFYNFTVVLRTVSAFWANIDPRIEQAASVLGANSIRRFITITLPLLRPSIVASALLVFIFNFTSFGVVLILGSTQYATLEVEIYRQTVNLFNLPVAAALSVVQIAFTLALTAIYTRIQSRAAMPLRLRPQSLTSRLPQSWRARLMVMTTVVAMLILLLSPLLALLFRAAEGGTRFLTELFINRRGSYFYVPPIVAVQNSVLVAVLTVFMSLLLGFLAAAALAKIAESGANNKWRWLGILDPLFMLPLGTSAVTLGFGYIIALDQPPLDLRASPVLLPIAHTLVAFPFVVRSILPVLRSINQRLRDAAGVLGASPQQVWLKVDLPIVGRAMLVAATFAFAISMGEFGATSLIARPDFPTITVVIYRFLGQPGALNYGQALVMSSLLAIICAAGIILIERVRIGDVGEF